jgi:hypothetical protein
MAALVLTSRGEGAPASPSSDSGTTGVATLVLTSSEEGFPGSPISDFGTVARGRVPSTPQLERSPPDRTTKATITTFQVLVNVFFIGLSFTIKTFKVDSNHSAAICETNGVFLQLALITIKLCT